MFGRHEIVKVIKKGDLDKLKEILEKEPGIVDQGFKFAFGYSRSSILHIAVVFNKPELIKFLVTEKGMAVDNQRHHSFTPLHYAVLSKSVQAVQALLELGANPGIKDMNNKTPSDYCKKNKELKELLLSTHQEQQRQKQEREKQRLEEAKNEAAARLAGRWEPLSDCKIMFEQELPEEGRRLKEIFDFAAGSLLLISKDLKDGMQSQETIFWDDEIKPKLKIKIDEAQAQLDKANGAASAAETAKPQGSVLLFRKASL